MLLADAQLVQKERDLRFQRVLLFGDVQHGHVLRLGVHRGQQEGVGERGRRRVEVTRLVPQHGVHARSARQLTALGGGDASELTAACLMRFMLDGGQR